MKTQNLNTYFSAVDNNNKKSRRWFLKLLSESHPDSFIKILVTLLTTLVYAFILGTIYPEMAYGGSEGYLIGLLSIFVAPHYFVIVLLSFIVKSIQLLAFFYILGLLFGARWLVLVPVVAYEFSNDSGVLSDLRSESFNKFFEGLSLLLADTSFSGVPLVVYSFLFGYLLVLSVRYFAAASLSVHRFKLTLIGAIVMAIPVLSIVAINIAGHDMYAGSMAVDKTIMLPDSDEIFSDGRYVYYAPINHEAGYYQNRNNLQIDYLNPDKREISESCIGQLKQTSNGNRYTETKKPKHKSNSSSQGLQGNYNQFNICFVIGSYKYLVIRDDGFTGDSYLAEFTSGQLVDAFRSGVSLIEGCNGFEKEEYCTEVHIQEWIKLKENSSNRLKLECKDGRYTRDLKPICGSITES